MGLRRSYRLKNELVYNPGTWAEWTKTNAVGDSSGLELTVFNELTDAYILTNLKANTKYGILLNVVLNELTFTFITELGAFQVNQLLVPAGATGNKKVVLTTLSNITNNRFYIKRSELESAPKKIKLKDISVFELPAGSEIEADFTNLTADQLAVKYPWFYDRTALSINGTGGLK